PLLGGLGDGPGDLPHEAVEVLLDVLVGIGGGDLLGDGVELLAVLLGSGLPLAHGSGLGLLLLPLLILGLLLFPLGALGFELGEAGGGLVGGFCVLGDRSLGRLGLDLRRTVTRWRLLLHLGGGVSGGRLGHGGRDRKSTRLNSSHVKNSYAVLCLETENILHDRI